MKRILNKEEVQNVLQILLELYPDAKAELNFTNPFELLIATILSAQCTDVRVNIVTEHLFKKYKYPSDIMDLDVDYFGAEIKTCGLYKTKSKNIIETCKILNDKYENKIPDTLEELILLPGVGRKTANVVLSNAFNVPAIAVDTHVFRVSNRIGIVKAKNVEDTEMQLMKKIKREMWTKAHHLFIFHGRRVCKAQNPNCTECKLTDYCLYHLKNQTRTER